MYRLDVFKSSVNLTGKTIACLGLSFKENTENHLTELNGAVIKNTGFRQKAMGGFAVMSFIGAIVLYKVFLGQ